MTNITSREVKNMSNIIIYISVASRDEIKVRIMTFFFIVNNFAALIIDSYAV